MPRAPSPFARPAERPGPRAAPSRRTLGVLTLASLSAAACEDSARVVPAGEGALIVEPTFVDLGQVLVGRFGRAPVALRSVGDRTVDFEARFVAPAAGFVFVNSAGSLQVGETARAEIFYRPRRPGAVSTRLELLADGQPAAEVEIRARGLQAPDCEDGNGCTVDRYDIERDLCVHEARRLPCDDFNGCTANDFCVDGICLGEGTSCDDGDICTDDLCDPRQGCVHTLRVECDDGNPCTEDTCDPTFGCRSSVLPNGTPCGTGNPCVESETCFEGRCVSLPADLACDDGDPCSTNDQCIDGRCQDPSYTPPGPGDVKYATDLGPLAPGSQENPLIAPDGTVFTGVEGGVAAVTTCGVLDWTAPIGTPDFRAALALPSLLVVPVGARLVVLEQRLGRVRDEIDLSSALPPPSDGEDAQHRVIDMAARPSGALVVSLVRETPSGSEGFLLEVDAAHEVVLLLARLGAQTARRLAVDRDQSLVLLLRETAPSSRVASERMVRLGIDGVPGRSWSTSPIETVRSDLALGAAGEVLWTAGLTRLEVDGRLRRLRAIPPIAADRERGAPVVIGPWVLSLEGGDGGRGALTARTSSDGAIAVEIPIEALAPATSPVVDRTGNVFVLDANGAIRAYSADGAPLFATSLPSPERPIEDVALGLSDDAVVVAVFGGRVYGVRAFEPLARSTWPRHRRDNFGTGNR